MDVADRFWSRSEKPLVNHKSDPKSNFGLLTVFFRCPRPKCILRNKIEEFLERKGIKYNNQFGFTEGGRVEHCLFILDYITNMSYQRRRRGGRNLYFAFIDFKKAYDSINREKLIEVLIEYKINPAIIDLIVQMYKNDNTIIKLGSMKGKIEVTGGIRQGCCISTLLFKMVTFKIIEELRKQKI